MVPNSTVMETISISGMVSFGFLLCLKNLGQPKQHVKFCSNVCITTRHTVKSSGTKFDCSNMADVLTVAAHTNTY